MDIISNIGNDFGRDNISTSISSSLSGRDDSKIYRQKVLLEVINSRHINYQDSDDAY